MGGPGRGRHRDAADVASGPGAVRQVLAGRQVAGVHRPVRRRRAGLRHAEHGRRAAPAHVLSGARAAHDPLGLRQPGVRLVGRRRAHPVPVASRRVGAADHAALHGRGDGRSSRAAADAGIGRRDLRAGRQAGRLLAALPRLPLGEALRRRPGQRPVHLRPGQPRRHADHRSPARRSRPDVDRRHDLLQLRSQRDLQPLRLRRREEDDDAGHVVDDVGRALAERGRPGGAHRLRVEWRAAAARHEERQGGGDRHHRARRWSGAAAQPHPGRHADPRRRAEPEGRAGAVRGARRHFHRADREGADAQPDALVGGARQVAAVVAGRPAHRLHVGHVGRGRALRRRAGRHRQAGGAHEGQPGVPLRAGLVAGRDPDRVRRQGRPHLRREGRRQDADADRRRARAARSRTTPGRRAGITWRSR